MNCANCGKAIYGEGEDWVHDEPVDPNMPHFCHDRYAVATPDEDSELRPGIRVRILHETQPVKEGYSYRIDDGQREVRAGTMLSIVEVYDAEAVAFRPGPNGGTRLFVADLAGVKVLYEGLAL